MKGHVFKGSNERHLIYSSSLHTNSQESGVALSEQLTQFGRLKWEAQAPYRPSDPHTFFSSFHYWQVVALLESITENCSLSNSIKSQAKLISQEDNLRNMTTSQPSFICINRWFYWAIEKKDPTEKYFLGLRTIPYFSFPFKLLSVPPCFLSLMYYLALHLIWEMRNI